MSAKIEWLFRHDWPRGEYNIMLLWSVGYRYPTHNLPNNNVRTMTSSEFVNVKAQT